MPVGTTDIGLMPRQVGMAEDHHIGFREPTAQASGSSDGRAAVMDGRELTPVEVEDEAFGQRHVAIVVPENGMDRSELLQRGEHRTVGDVAGVNDDVGSLEVGAQCVDESSLLTRPKVGVGYQQDVHATSLAASARAIFYRAP